MKKWFALLFILLLTFSAAAIAEETYAETSPGKLVGTWYADTAVFGDTTYRPTGDVRLELNRDKTAQFIHNDLTHTFTWDLSNDRKRVMLTLDNPDAMMFNPNGGTNDAGALIINVLEDGTYYKSIGAVRLTYTFTKENNTTVLPAAVAASEEDLLFGTYTGLYAMDNNNAELLPEGSLTVRIDFAEAELTTDSSSELCVTDFVDGKLKLSLASGKYLAYNLLKLDNTMSTLTISLTEDASMIVVTATDDAGTVGGTFYLVKNAE